jgi:hypothetical protein
MIPSTSYRVLTVILAMTLLSIPAIFACIGVANNSPLPSRDEQLAAVPAFPRRLDDWGRLPAQIERYLNDHFGLRRQMITAWAVIVHRWLQNGNSAVQIGYDDWMFFRTEDTVGQSAGYLMRHSEVIETADTIRRISDKLSSEGIRFVFAPTPNSATIYPEHLPAWARKPRGAQTEYDLLLKELKLRNVPTLDLRPALSAAKQGGKLYYQHDTHWAPRGTLVGFNTVAVARLACGHSQGVNSADGETGWRPRPYPRTAADRRA